MFCYLYSPLNGKIAFYLPFYLLVTDNDALHVIHIFLNLTFSFILFHRHSITTVLDLLPHIWKFDCLNSKVARQQCLIRIRVELKKKKSAERKANSEQLCQTLIHL